MVLPTRTNMQDLFDLTVPFSITYAKAYPLFKPGTVYVHAELSADFSDPTGATNLPKGTILKAVATNIQRDKCEVVVTTRNNVPVIGAKVDVTYATFQ